MYNRLPADVLDFLNKMNQKGEFYLVGGAVRDLVLGRVPKDFDVMTTTPEVMDPTTAKVGADFPVWLCKTGKRTLEVAAARKETKVAAGYKGFTTELTTDLQEDLLRRDLTINAMAWHPETGLTMGAQAHNDLNVKVLRHVSPAFVEDPLRVFRLARFAAQLNWPVASETYDLLRTMSSELPALKMDRVQTELLKAMNAPAPWRFFEVLMEGNCLQHWFPEIHEMVNCEQSPQHHPEGPVFKHTMCVLRKVKEFGGNADACFAGLSHDFGKPVVRRSRKDDFNNHPDEGVPVCTEFGARFSLSERLTHTMATVTKHHHDVHNAAQLRLSTLVRLVESLKRTTIGLDGALLVCQADAQGRGPEKAKEPYPQRQFVLDAAAVMNTVDFSNVPNMNGQKRHEMLISALKNWKKSQTPF
jgi:tRNA nucleotidyltransferase (CCA-adding enzyme)